MKAVVLARGLGRRMQQDDDGARLDTAQQLAAGTGQKAMMPVGGREGRPFLDYVLSGLADAGVADVCLVVAPDHAVIRSHYDRARPTRLKVRYAVQHEATGTAQAVLAARTCVAADPFLVLNADNLYPVDVLRALVTLGGPGLPAFERAALVEQSGFPPDRVAQFAVLTVDASGHLAGIREKPPADDPSLRDPHALISMNAWRFDVGIFEACAQVPRSSRGEFELPEAVALAVARGARFTVVRGDGAVLDLSRRGDVAHVAGQLAGLDPRL